MARQTASHQHDFFRMLSGHPSFRDAVGWLFEDYAHNRLSEPKREPLEALLAHEACGAYLPAPAQIIAGSTALEQIQPPFNFYWRPVKSNFKGIDAIIRSGDDVWALQYTISQRHVSATDGLIEIRNGMMNHKRNVNWHLVMVSPDLRDAMEARDDQKIGDDWEWGIQVYACQLPLGQFQEEHACYLETVLNNVSTQKLLECS